MYEYVLEVINQGGRIGGSYLNLYNAQSQLILNDSGSPMKVRRSIVDKLLSNGAVTVRDRQYVKAA
jgi:hypothetical protein